MFHIGIVEDNNDPKKLGRLKVRIFGVHTENRNKSVDDVSKHMTTNDLPWCIAGMPLTNSNVDGTSDFSPIAKGTKLLCGFLDIHKQQPIALCVLPYIATELPDFDKGFSDPSSQHPSEEYLNESSISRLARNEKMDETIVKIKKENVEEFDVCGQTINEPETEYEAVYPNNRVIETASGHIIEIDDTDGKERIHFYHKSGTFTEVFPDGKAVTKINGANYSLILGKDNIYIASDLNMRIGGKCNVEIVDEAHVIFNEATTIEAKKDLTINGSEKVIINSDSDIELNGDNTKIIATSNLKIESSGTLDIDCADATIDATGTITAKATLISMN